MKEKVEKKKLLPAHVFLTGMLLESSERAVDLQKLLESGSKAQHGKEHDHQDAVSMSIFCCETLQGIIIPTKKKDDEESPLEYVQRKLSEIMEKLGTMVPDEEEREHYPVIQIVAQATEELSKR